MSLGIIEYDVEYVGKGDPVPKLRLPKTGLVAAFEGVAVRKTDKARAIGDDDFHYERGAETKITLETSHPHHTGQGMVYHVVQDTVTVPFIPEEVAYLLSVARKKDETVNFTKDNEARLRQQIKDHQGG